MKSSPTLSIVILSYNTAELLKQCLESVYDTLADIEAEVFVVDNHSPDNSVSLVEKFFPQVHLIANQENVGYAKGNNQALRQCRGEFILLLNPDTVVLEGTFRKTIQYLDSRSDAGVLTCKVIRPDGTLDLACRRSFPTPAVAFWRLVGMSRLFPKSKFFARYNLTYLDEDEIYDVDAVMGAFMLIKREAFLEVGLLDESFFMYGEDLDWCYRFRQAGYNVVYYPKASIIHYKGASSKNRRPVRMVQEFHNAMIAFYRKYFAKQNFFLVNWIIRLGVWVHFMIDLTSSKLSSKSKDREGYSASL